MSILHLEWSKTLRTAGKILDRDGMSKRVMELVGEFNKERSYKKAIELAGRLSAITQMAKCDIYWNEKCQHGFHLELSRATYLVNHPPATQEPRDE